MTWPEWIAANYGELRSIALAVGALHLPTREDLDGYVGDVMVRALEHPPRGATDGERREFFRTLARYEAADSVRRWTARQPRGRLRPRLQHRRRPQDQEPSAEFLTALELRDALTRARPHYARALLGGAMGLRPAEVEPRASAANVYQRKRRGKLELREALA